MFAYVGSNSVEVFPSLEEAIELGFEPSDLYTLVVFVKDAPTSPCALMASGLATALIARAQKIAVIVITGGNPSAIAFEHYDAVVAAFAVLLDRLHFADAHVEIASGIARDDHSIVPANLLLPPELPF
jgi:hypothetical protein